LKKPFPKNSVFKKRQGELSIAPKRVIAPLLIY